ncbi:MAG: PhoH family protein, partial [Bacteroidota bacterium]
RYLLENTCMSKKPSTTRTRKNEDISDIVTGFNNSLLSTLRLDIKHKNETQKKLIQSIKKNDVTICTGPAGTGKTLLSVFEALELLKSNPDKYKQIKLVKSITQLRNEELGILPGDEKEKLKFHMMSFMDAFYKLIGEGNTNKLLEAKLIDFEVFGAIRGRSFENVILIVDEFQNISHDNAKTFLTRFSDNTKTIILGDCEQIDIKNKKDSSLQRLVHRVKKTPVDGVDVVEFNESDIVRHRLTSYFINIFKEPTEEPKTKEIKVEPDKKLNWVEKFLKNFK